ncbi:MAG: hypothetical protein M3308_02935 [Actinomycetota bacterium]|nr:hypothetical protein [Actinomycetota bacterium]
MAERLIDVEGRLRVQADWTGDVIKGQLVAAPSPDNTPVWRRELAREQ